MKKLILALVLGATGTAASAGPVLWQDIEAGMTPEQVQQLYPAGKGVKHGKGWTSLSGVKVADCKGHATVEYKGGTVSKVKIFGTGCATRLFTALVGKYGEPASSDTAKHKLGGFDRKVSLWRAEGRVIRYKGNPESIVSDWELVYQPIDAEGI
jgi:hypothetical protein